MASVLVRAALLMGTSAATDYFISSSNSQSSDSNSGTDPDQPWRTLQRASQQPLQPGDTIQLLFGDVWSLHSNDTWAFNGLRGPISFGAYSDSSGPLPVRPLILKGPLGSGSVLTFENCSGITITDLELAGGEQGVVFIFDVDNSKPLPTVFSGFNITDVQFRNIAGLDPQPAAADWWGVAIAFAARHAGVVTTNVTIDRVHVSDSDTLYINSLQKPAGAFTRPYMSGVTISRCSMTRMSFNTLFLDTTDNVVVQNNVFYRDTPSSLFVAGTTDIILGSVNVTVNITGNEIGWRGEYAPGGPDGCGIDFETAAVGVQLTNNYIHHSYGAGVMVFGHETTSTNLLFRGNIMLSNGCNQTRGDKGGIAFMHLNQSGVITGNVFTTCPGNNPPLFNPLSPGAMDGWDIRDNVVDGTNGTVLVMPAPTVTWQAFNGSFVATATCPDCPPGATLKYSLAGRPMVGDPWTFDWPGGANGTLTLPPRGTGLWVKTLPPASMRDAVGAMAQTVSVESEAVGDVLAWPRG